MLTPVEVKALPNYTLHVRFSDGIEGDVDLSHLVGVGVFSFWNDAGNFERVSIGPSGEIRWTDKIDMCPDAIYMQITGKAPEEVFPKLAGEQIDA